MNKHQLLTLDAIISLYQHLKTAKIIIMVEVSFQLSEKLDLKLGIIENSTDKRKSTWKPLEALPRVKRLKTTIILNWAAPNVFEI